MRNSTPRQKHLYLVARLYELAAEFSDEELRAVSSALKSSDEDSAIRQAVDALVRLHGVVENDARRLAQAEELQENDVEFVQMQLPYRRGSLSARYLTELFENRDIFPRVQDIAELVPGSLDPAPKEGRHRYIRRVAKFVASLDETEKIAFKAALSKKLERQSGGFISQWKNLIREL